MSPLPESVCGCVAAAGRPSLTGASDGKAGCTPGRLGKHESVNEGDVRALARLLAAATSPAVGNEGQSQRSSRFHAVRVPPISIADYILRMLQHFKCSHGCYLVASIYVDRVLLRNPDFVLSVSTAHRLVLASMVVAVKFTDDTIFPNTWYAQIGGVSVRELNTLEAELLQLIGWEGYVTEEEFERCLAKLREPEPAKQPVGTPTSGAKRARAEIADDEDTESTGLEDSSAGEEATETLDETETASGSPTAEAGAASPSSPRPPTAAADAARHGATDAGRHGPAEDGGAWPACGEVFKVLAGAAGSPRGRKLSRGDLDVASLLLLGPCFAWACRSR